MIQTSNNNNIEITTYTLSIQVSLNGLSFCIANSEPEIISLYQDHFGIRLTPEQVLEKIKYLFDHNTDLKKDFDTIEVIYQNELNTIVPKALFNEDVIKEYLKYNIKVLENDFITHDELHQHDIVNIYIPYANINNYFFETFGSFVYKHSTTILIDSILSKEKNSDITSVFAHMNHTSFDLIIIDKGKLILSNSYIYETSEDFLYYLMFAAEQLRLNPEEFTLIFLGEISKTDSCYTIAHQYIRNIRFGNSTNSTKISQNIAAINSHQHFVLLSHF